jgi:D-tyrosyl-tRNA(Tyr) deacylase
MRLVLQRVASARVTVDGEVVGSIGRGILALVGVEREDGAANVERAIDKLAELRIFEDEAGKLNLGVGDASSALLVVSQFTLAASLARGRRPSFDAAAPPERARPLIESLVAGLRERGLEVATGRFGARMQVALVNDGPVTFVLDV